MFWFAKKNKEKKEVSHAEPAQMINKEELIKQAEVKVKELESVQGDDYIVALNQIGSLYYQAEELDKAIKYYEKSLELKKVMGKSYTDLMSLYNKKRQMAAEAKNDEEISYYLAKVQEMMQISKDMLRGKI